MAIDDIIVELRDKDPDALGDNEIPDEVRNKTPEQLHQLVEVIDAHLRSLHQTDQGELRDLTTAEDKAFRYGIRVRKAAIDKIEEHRAITEVFTRRPQAVKAAYANIKAGLDPIVGGVVRLANFEARDMALRTLDDRASSAHLRPDEKDQLERQIRRNTEVARRIIVTENDQYRNAWMKLVTHPNGALLLDEDERNALRAYDEYRAASSTNAAGGFGIPVMAAA